eukprot:CAMPEP_0182462024 /NCGR_PEP_ID=MMETSP1319-20130603/6422_1 /TAXON_ID=172717 /ORGANISM="Bolidomonas pacifica, Strain RCC208" /LENGTH=141 /DNA_ID=CAMNT_0024661391 /DNA_START=122 /DNA_END=547 /DNA_ORIENTATION=-
MNAPAPRKRAEAAPMLVDSTATPGSALLKPSMLLFILLGATASGSPFLIKFQAAHVAPMPPFSWGATVQPFQEHSCERPSPWTMCAGQKVSMPCPLLHHPDFKASFAAALQKQFSPALDGQVGYLKPQCSPGPAKAKAPGA